MEKEMLEKMLIRAYTTDRKGSKAKYELIGEMEVQVNPESISQSFNISFDSNQATGSRAKKQRNAKQSPYTIQFQLIFDQTGVLATEEDLREGFAPYPVKADIDYLQELLLTYNGKIHRPNTVKIMWGDSVNFTGRLKQMGVEYKLFRRNGQAIRAKVNISFEASEDPKEIQALAKMESPDISHLRTLVQGDTLPLLCEEIYEDPLRFLQVAKANQLINFRRIQPNDQLTFPPIAKE